MKYGMTESFTLISMLIFGAGIKSFTTRMFKSNSGEPYAGKLHVRFLEEFISNCLIIREGENLLMHFWDEHKTITRYYEMKMSGVCEKYNLRQMEYDILMFLYNNPEYNTAADIVRIRKSTKSHVSTSLKVLEDRGLIERRVDPANKKRVTLHLLQLANEVIEDGKWAQKEFAQDMFDGLSEEEIRSFMNVFQKVYDNAERMISNEKNAGFNGSNF